MTRAVLFGTSAPMSDPLWKLVVTGLTLSEAERLSDALDDIDPPLAQAAAIDNDPADERVWHLEVYCPDGTDPKAAAAAVSGLAKSAGLGHGEVAILTFEDQDWVAKVQADLSPVIAGRFFVHGSHDRGRAPHNAIAIEIDAAQAFGTGHHATTAGCLLALDAVLKQAHPRAVLDVGCGSGVLAIAAARALHSRTVATDIDPLAVRIAAENIHANGIQASVRTAVARETHHNVIRAAAPFDLVFANILARPLQALAPEIAAVLAPGGRAILSGLTCAQEARVVSAYRIQGLALEERVRMDGWSTLTLRKGGAA